MTMDFRISSLHEDDAVVFRLIIGLFSKCHIRMHNLESPIKNHARVGLGALKTDVKNSSLF